MPLGAVASSETDVRPVEGLAFRAMGTSVEVILVGETRPGEAQELLCRARERIGHLERRWSRFRCDSDLTRMNDAGGAPVILPADTFDLIALAVAWATETGGTFDPTIIDALELAGYDRTFDALEPGIPAASPDPDVTSAAPGVHDIDLDFGLRSVRLPPGVRLDLGGIGKGRAADLVVDELAPMVGAGTGLCVNLGGDLRAIGEGPGGAWGITVDDPFDAGRSIGVLALKSGAVATSATTARSWVSAGRRRHHLIDPRTGAPSDGMDGSVTVIASTVVEAEVRAKAAVIEGAHGVRRLIDEGFPTLAVDASGLHVGGGMEEYLR